MAKTRHIPYKPSFVEDTRMRVNDGEWLYTFDGDWRGLNERLGLRTRYKNTLDAAKEDVRLGRLQRRTGQDWHDSIRG